MKRFFCDKCGKCCEKLPALVIDPGLDDGTGKCKFYDSQTNLWHSFTFDVFSVGTEFLSIFTLDKAT